MLNLNIEEKLITTVKRLNELRTVKKERIPVWITDEIIDKQVLPTDCCSWTPFDEPFMLFEQEKYYWFKASFDVQDVKETENVFLCIETFIDGVACTIRPQGLLYLNGKLIQGIDINHTDILLKEGKYEMYLLFYTHTFIRSLPVYFSLKYVEKRIEQLYYDLYAPLDVLKILDKKTNEYINSATALERVVNLIDFRQEYSEQFYASLDKARNYLKENYYDKLCGSSQTVHCIGHTHIDVAWLWTLDQTKEKIERSFSTVLALMEEFPEYKFMSSQPQLYAYLKERNPELYEKVKEKVKEGRWEVEGSMWLEADCNLTSGESLVRQILYGKQFFLEEFGKDCKVVWEPDVFGYSAALPQIMKKTGIEKFVTAKIGLNDTNRMPYDTFIWQGIDGSQVLAYLISTCNSIPRKGIYDGNETTYVGRLNAEQVLGTWNRYQPKEYNDVTFMTYGWGDGGGGPTREMLEMQRRFAYGLPGIPKTKMSTVEETLLQIEENFKRNALELKRVPKWNGEIYFEYHRGTYTSVPKNKKNNRKGEFALQNGEFIGVLGKLLCDMPYPKEEISKDWKTLLLNQFHDILPGSAVKEVYDESDKQYKALFDNQTALAGDRLNKIAENIKTEGGIFVFNPNGFKATGTVLVNGETKVVTAPPLGYTVVEEQGKNANNVFVSDGVLENEYYRLVFDNTGAIISLYDKRFSRELVKKGEKLNEMRVYEDMPYQYDNWEIAPYFKQKEWILDGVAEFQEVRDGDRAGYLITKKYFNSVIRQKVFLYNGGLERIDFVTNVEWKEKCQLLKTSFAFDMLVDKATYDIQFGNLERSTSANTSWESAKFECVGQKWVDMSENNYGVALLNDGKYGFGTEDNELSLTMLKSGSYPYDGAADEIPEFTYSLYPHGGDFRQGGVIEAAYILNRGLQSIVLNKQEGCLQKNYSLLLCDTPGVYVETVKQAEKDNGIVLRAYEAFKETKTVCLKFNRQINEAYLCDLQEKEETVLAVVDDAISFAIKPFEIITIKIK